MNRYFVRPLLGRKESEGTKGRKRKRADNAGTKKKGHLWSRKGKFKTARMEHNMGGTLPLGGVHTMLQERNNDPRALSVCMFSGFNGFIGYVYCAQGNTAQQWRPFPSSPQKERKCMRRGCGHSRLLFLGVQQACLLFFAPLQPAQTARKACFRRELRSEGQRREGSLFPCSNWVKWKKREREQMDFFLFFPSSSSSSLFIFTLFSSHPILP